MRFEPRAYQTEKISAIVKELTGALRQRRSSKIGESVLGTAPASGKTVMSIKIIERLLSATTAKKALVLTHGTDVIKNQYLKELAALRPSFTFEAYRPKSAAGHVPLRDIKAQVIVALPQSLRSLTEEEWSEFDIVIVDEAHHYYHKAMVQEILRLCGARAALALTGTPSPFVYRGVLIHSIGLGKLYRQKYVSDVFVQLAVSDFKFTRADYSDVGELTKRACRKIKTREVRSTLDRMLGDLAKAIGEAHGKAMKDNRSSRQTWEETLNAARKTMIVCATQKMARAVHDYFKALRIRSLLSISEEIDSTEEIDRFKMPRERLLIVVNRGSLGFDYGGMITLVDMTGTINIDRIFQMFCRVVRKHPDGGIAGRGKMYFKLVSKEMVGISDLYVHAAMSLSSEELIKTWNGRDLNGMVMYAPVEDDGETGDTRAHATGRRGALALVEDCDEDADGEDVELAEFRDKHKRGKKAKIKPRRRRMPPRGFFWGTDYYLPIFESQNKRARCVRSYVKTTLGAALASIGERKLSTKELDEDMARKVEAIRAEHGRFPDPERSEYERHLAVWMRSIARRNEAKGYRGRRAA